MAHHGRVLRAGPVHQHGRRARLAVALPRLRLGAHLLHLAPAQRRRRCRRSPGEQEGSSLSKSGLSPKLNLAQQLSKQYFLKHPNTTAKNMAVVVVNLEDICTQIKQEGKFSQRAAAPSIFRPNIC